MARKTSSDSNVSNRSLVFLSINPNTRRTLLLLSRNQKASHLTFTGRNLNVSFHPTSRSRHRADKTEEERIVSQNPLPHRVSQRWRTSRDTWRILANFNLNFFRVTAFL